MNCEKAGGQLVEYLKKEMDTEQSTAVEEHLRDCENCSQELKILSNAFFELENFSVIDTPCEISAVVEKARQRVMHQTRNLRLWWTTAATGVAALVVFFVMNNQPQPSVPIAKKISPVLNTAEKKNDALKIVKNAVGFPHIANKIKTPGKVRIAAKVKNTRHYAGKSKQPAPQPIQLANTDAGSNSILVAHIDAISQYLLLADHNRAINCSVLPVVATDDADQAVADTITATVICKLKEQFGGAAISRTTLFTGINDDISKVIDEAKKLSVNGSADNNYLIIGSVSKAKSGYLFSLKIINCADDSIVNGNNHPVLIPEDNFKTAFLMNNEFNRTFA